MWNEPFVNERASVLSEQSSGEEKRKPERKIEPRKVESESESEEEEDSESESSKSEESEEESESETDKKKKKKKVRALWCNITLSHTLTLSHAHTPPYY